MQPALYDEVELLRSYVTLPQGLHGAVVDINIVERGAVTVEFFDDDATVHIVPTDALRVVRRYEEPHALRAVGG
jgi:hypothetical protein